MSKLGYIIRNAKREDCPGIWQLIKELAEFEKMPEQCNISVSDLERDGFDCSPPLFYCIVVEANDCPNSFLGYALYHYAYSTWCGKALHLEDIYVPLSRRQQGIGAAMFAQTAKIAKDTDCQRLEFVCLDWNPAKDFYKAQGSEDLTETEKWHSYCVRGEELDKLALKAKCMDK